jgi:hypothetical protein
MVDTKKEVKAESLPNGVTAEMIKSWKERYGEKKVKIATLKDDDDVFPPFDVVIRRPGRVEMGEFEKWYDKKPDKAKDILIKSCLLSHKDEVSEDEDKFLHAFNAIAELLPISKATIKNS